MGTKSSAEVKSEAARQKMKGEIEDIYCMFDETIEAVRTSKLKESGLDQQHPTSSSRSQPVKSSRICNLDSVLDQLLESFREKECYIWGKDICKMFKKHFRLRFEEMWPINKQEFYKLVLSRCNFETIDLRNQLKEIAESMEIYELSSQRRLSYERYFYEVGAAKIQQKLPSSFVGEDVLPWEESFRQPDDRQTQLNMHAINETIIKHQNQIMADTEEVEKVQEEKEGDFLPLFISSNANKKSRITQQPILSEAAKHQIYTNARVQNATIIAPETVFFERLTEENKAEISDLVKFYREFANGLQQMFFSSTSMVSAPYKHFIYCLEEKMKRKNIKNKQKSHPSKSKIDKLLLSDKPEAKKERQRRDFNNRMMLKEIRDFAQAYTDFVWMFLELNQIGESKLGKLLNIYTVYGIVVKSIWKFVEWISDRGCEYEEAKIEQYYHNQSMPNNPRIPLHKKKALLTLLRGLVGEKNPQKYLKKIVVFYRQANKQCTCADELLGIFEQLLIYLIKEGQAKEMALFRMPGIIEGLLKLEEALSSAGEISYSWTTWCIVIEMLKDRIGCGHSHPLPELVRVETEPDYEEVILEE